MNKCILSGSVSNVRKLADKGVAFKLRTTEERPKNVPITVWGDFHVEDGDMVLVEGAFRIDKVEDQYYSGIHATASSVIKLTNRPIQEDKAPF